MPPPVALPLAAARRLVLAAQRLDGAAPAVGGRAAALAALEHLGHVQLEAIAVVERAHHHVLWARVPGYRPADLEALRREDRAVFEHWAHAAALLPVRDWRFALPRMRAIRSGREPWWRPRPTAEMRRVLARIRREGALRTADFERPAGPRGDGWGTRSPAKRALEQLLYEGRLMVARREGLEKVYDLTERVLPPWADRRPATPAELAAHWVERALRADALVTVDEACHNERQRRPRVAAELQRRRRSGELVEVEVAGAEGPVGRWLARAADLDGLGALPPLDDRLRVLSPFDPLVLRRRRTRALFGVDLTLECYLPPARRTFGYFVLPLLWRGALVGRADARAERAAGRLLVRRLDLEPGVRPSAALRRALAAGLRDFAAFNGCGAVTLERVAPEALRRPLARLL